MMRYPTALHITPGRSVVYSSIAFFLTIFLIATCLYFIRASNPFGIKSIVFLILCSWAAAWLIYDTRRVSQGHLYYAQGQWGWLKDRENSETSHQTRGTLRIHLDLHKYLLVSFVAHQSSASFFKTTTQWFHLEERRISVWPPQADWSDVRRALHSTASTVAAESAQHEKRAV